MTRGNYDSANNAGRVPPSVKAGRNLKPIDAAKVASAGYLVDKRQISESTTAHNMLAYSNGNCPVLKTERG